MVDSPVPYLPSDVIRGSAYGIGDFSAPDDLFVSADRKIYLLDSGNGRIVVFDENWRLVRTLAEFRDGEKPEKLSGPKGIYVTPEGTIFVADTGNKRVVEMDAEGRFLRILEAPKSDVLRAGFDFVPSKIALDQAKRIYVVGEGVFDGIMEFDFDGEFIGFTGTNRVRFNAADYFWKTVSTREQKDKMVMFVPVEFNNLDVDDEGFLYSTTSEKFSANPIQRLNPSGTDILRRDGYNPPAGDAETAAVGSSMNGPSVFADIAAGPAGTYSALDTNRGRVFTYNEDGDLLYIFGQRGNQAGTFKTPVAIDRVGDRIIVLDRDFRHIVVFEPTAFGAAVNEAVLHHFEGREELSAGSWEKVLSLNGNYDIAYIGIGKALLRQNRYKEAMDHFQNGHNRKYYSKAFALYRKQLLREHFGTAMTGLLAAAAVYAAIRAVRRKRRKEAHAVT